MQLTNEKKLSLNKMFSNENFSIKFDIYYFVIINFNTTFLITVCSFQKDT